MTCTLHLNPSHAPSLPQLGRIVICWLVIRRFFRASRNSTGFAPLVSAATVTLRNDPNKATFLPTSERARETQWGEDGTAFSRPTS